MQRTARRALIAAAITGIVLVVAFAFRPEPVSVETARVTRGPLEVTIDEDGETRAHDRYTLASPVAGKLSRIDLHEGDAVSLATAIAIITPLPIDPREAAELRAQIQSAEALRREAEKQVARRVADHDQALSDLRRAKELAKSGIISKQELEQAGTHEEAAAKELESAEFRVQSAAAEVKRAEAGLMSLEARSGEQGKALVLRASTPGRVLRILEKSERVVAAGTPLVVLSDPKHIEVVVDLLSTDAVKIRDGAPVWIENWGGAAPLRGRVRLVEPYGYTKVSALGVEEQRVNVVVDFVDSPDGLGDGYRVDARIVLWQGSDVIKAPVSALFRSGQSWSLFAVEEQHAVQRFVEIGHRNSLEAEILTGIAPGTEVILHPGSELKPGMRVRTRR